MSERRVSHKLLDQLEDVLEERQGRDRRQVEMGLPPGVPADRRKGERRAISAQRSL